MTGKFRNYITELEEMAVGYEKSHPLLTNINLSISRGEMIALIGRNGTGKSTLLKSMIGLVPLLEGNCRLEGAPLQLHDPRKRAQMVSYVSSQISQLPAISVFELVVLGRMPHTGWLGKMTDNDKELVERAVSEVHMESYIERKLDQLSDGERQRAMIARAFVQNTPLMVLDEPTAFLDIPNKYELIRLLTGFRNQGKSIVYSTHDLDTALMCADKLWVIHGGKIIEGAPEDLGLMDIFDTLFEGTGISFDETNRRFRYNEITRGSIKLTGGPGKAIDWTRSALDRMGIIVTENADSLLRVNQTTSGYEWVYTGHNHTCSFENILGLARFLIKDK